MPAPNLTQRQAKWFASVRAGLERDTGKSMAEWVAIARTCPEEAHRARLKWLKDHHGLLQNRAAQVLLGVAVMTAANPRLEAPKTESWSERLKARTLLSSPAEVDGEIELLLRAAWDQAG